MSVEVLRLYRHLLRTAGKIQKKSIRKKLRYGVQLDLLASEADLPFYAILYAIRFNIREVFELYAAETDPNKIEELLSLGSANLSALQRLSKWDSEMWNFGGPGDE